MNETRKKDSTTAFFEKLINMSNKKLMVEFEKKLRGIVREEMDFYYEKVNKAIVEHVQSGGKPPIREYSNPSSSNTNNLKNDTVPNNPKSGEFDMDMIRKKIRESASSGNAMPNANMTVDLDGETMVEVPEIDTRIVKDYSSLI